MCRSCVCDGDGVSESLLQTLAAFERHLRSERGRSEHTTRAYLGDLRGLLRFLQDECGMTDLADVGLRELRAWLAAQAESGAARSTIARRSAAARTFLGWATRTGRIAQDPSLRLAAPKRAGHLPEVLRQCDATALMDLAAVASDDQDPMHLRDRAAVELLYASGIRVGELTALDIDDLDLAGGVVRVMGKGGKERTVPFGAPAREAVRGLAGPRSPPGGRRGQRPGPAAGPTRATRRPPADPGRGPRAALSTCLTPRTSGRTACGTALPPTSSRAGPTCGWCRSCSAMPHWRRRRSTRTSPSTGSRPSYRQAHPRA